MSPRFQADADLNQKIVQGLRRREPAIDFKSAKEGEVIGRADPEILKLAAEDGRVLVSHDRKTMLSHFARFVRNQTSPGLIILSQDVEIARAIEDLLLVWSAMSADECQNCCIFLPL